MFTSHTYTLDNDIQIFFTDSGPIPNSSDYTTLIVLHGGAFTGHSFEKLHDCAKDYNLRTVIWNRRDYPGSSPYTDEEIEDLKQGKQIFLDRLGKQIAQFICKFVSEEHIPPTSEDRRKGGVALMGWSIGAATGMSLFSDSKLISTETYQALEPHVKDLIQYDPPYLAFGLTTPPGSKTYNPWADPNCHSAAELYRNFTYWVSSYYDHPNVSGSIHELDFRSRTDTRSLENWTPEQFAKYYCESTAVRSEHAMTMPPMQATLAQLKDKVLFDENLAQTYFPKLAITHLVADRSPWETIFGSNEIKRLYKEYQEQGKKVRPISFYTLKGCNHFAHYDNVDTLMSTVLQAIQS